MQSDLSTLPGRGPLVVACAECGTPLRIFPSFLTYRPHPTCSRTCRAVRQTRLARERNSRPCVVCSTVFYDTPGSFEKEHRKTCGLECRAIWQTGRPLAKPGSLLRRWGAKRIVNPGACYGWNGATSGGYGVLGGPDKSMVRAHRFAWEHATGETLTDDDFICHTCDTRVCTNIEDEGVYDVDGVLLPRRGHLFKGTSALNFDDMRQKGRQSNGVTVGERNIHAKLTETQVRQLRSEHDGGAAMRALAARYGITYRMVWLICHRRAWKHVE